ncbi:MAG: Kazal-type serine protease inhibitor domain-containing protein [Candidatus Andersenbacteria bacterium]
MNRKTAYIPTVALFAALIAAPVAFGQEVETSAFTLHSVSPSPIQPGQQSVISGANLPLSFTVILSGQGGVFRDFGASDIPSRGFFTLPQRTPAGSYQMTLSTSDGVTSNTIAVQVGGSAIPIPQPTPQPPVATPRPTPRPTPITQPPRQAECICIEILAPVCGVDNRTYANQCLAQCNNVPVALNGVCSGDQEFINRFRPPQEQINPTPVPRQRPELETECDRGTLRCLGALGRAIERFGGSFGLRDAINVLQIQLNRVAGQNRTQLQQFIRDLQS